MNTDMCIDKGGHLDNYNIFILTKYLVISKRHVKEETEVKGIIVNEASILDPAYN